MCSSLTSPLETDSRLLVEAQGEMRTSLCLFKGNVAVICRLTARCSRFTNLILRKLEATSDSKPCSHSHERLLYLAANGSNRDFWPHPALRENHGC